MAKKKEKKSEFTEELIEKLNTPDKCDCKCDKSEIIRGFVDFITSRKNPITASSRHDKTVWHKEIERYLDETNNSANLKKVE